MRATMRRLFYGLSGDTIPTQRWHPIQQDPHATMLDSVPYPTQLPQWLTEGDLDLYAETFQRTGFRGGLNWYRNFDRNWELLAAFSSGKIMQPSLFMYGEQDPTLEVPAMDKRIERMSEVIPHLRTVALADCGHWMQVERAEEVNSALLAFFREL